MKQELFVDTGGFYALQVPNDRWHSAAVSTLQEALASKRLLITSNQVVGETYTLLLKTHGHRAAWKFRDTLSLSTRLEIVWIDELVEKEAWALLKKYSDQAFSFVDGTSFALMRQRRIKHAFAFDAHFAAAGFTRVPVDGR
jgi:uncharacterized protein